MHRPKEWRRPGETSLGDHAMIRTAEDPVCVLHSDSQDSPRFLLEFASKEWERGGARGGKRSPSDARGKGQAGIAQRSGKGSLPPAGSPGLLSPIHIPTLKSLAWSLHMCTRPPKIEDVSSQQTWAMHGA